MTACEGRIVLVGRFAPRGSNHASAPLSGRVCVRFGTGRLGSRQGRDDQVPGTEPGGCPLSPSVVAGEVAEVIKKGNTGEVHYFEHASGQVAGVKFFPSQETP